MSMRWTLRPLAWMGVAALMLATAAGTARASFTFSFTGLSNNAGNAAVQSNMNAVLGGQGSVTVSGAVASNSYNGDGHVVGSGTGTTSKNLSNWNIRTSAAYATTQMFLMNNQGESSVSSDPHSDRITMAFSGLVITGVSFDYQIFPDANSAPPTAPDFEFATNMVPGGIFTQLGISPGTAGSYSATWTHSPVSGSGSTETYKQFLGSYTNLSLAAGTTSLSFIDWPDHIGINNLTIYGSVAVVPEPASWALMACAFAAVPAFRRFRAARAA